MLQTLAKLLLPFRRETPETGVVLQGSLLLGGGQVFVPPQPVAGVALRLRTRLRRPRRLLARRLIGRSRMLGRSMKSSRSLRQARERQG